MIYSKIKYGISAYGLATNNNVIKIQVMQNKLIKILLDKNNRYSTNRIHNEIGALKIDDLANQEISSFVHNYLNNNLPEVFPGYFKPFK